ncbi:MAG: single-stranded-DNA-specific exonuclease RecJ [Planctomycetota bacterium]|nr:single-stranded-DNA-specific exonuclease RecJ [Planctomycetota bacterium]
MSKTWRFLPYDVARVRELAAQLRISPILAQVLTARGYETAESARGFLDSKLTELHDPELLPGISEAADRVVAALKSNRKIVIYGDYDVDGVTSTALLWHCLKLAGGTVEYYLPHRLEEGYGLNCEALEKLHAADPQSLVVSVDCGICSVVEAARARELGLELIITDHHEMDATLPDAAVLVHPRLPGSKYPFGELCGVGVAFKLAWAVCARLGDGKKAEPRMREFLLAAIGLAAIGTVADVVPLVGENRVLVRYGLGALRERASLGLRALFGVTKLEEKKLFEAEDVGFALAPRINAAGRLGQARLAVELLASYLDEQNKTRQTVERRMVKQAKELVAEHPEWATHPALVLAHYEWHAGIIGIVASRIAEHYQKPTVLIALNAQDGMGQGSARSFAGYDLHAGLASCSQHLTKFGGHQAAAGLRISADLIDEFRLAFCEKAGTFTASPRDLELQIDAEIRLAELTVQAVTELERLGPFGRSNPRPVFVSTRVELAEPPRTMGEGDRHLSLRLRHYGKVLRAVAFGRGEWAAEIAAAPGPLSISFAPVINRFRGQQNVELQLMDWKSEK